MDVVLAAGALTFLALFFATSLWTWIDPFQAMRRVFVLPFGPLFRISSFAGLTHDQRMLVEYLMSHTTEDDDGSRGAALWFKMRGPTRVTACFITLMAVGLFVVIFVSP